MDAVRGPVRPPVAMGVAMGGLTPVTLLDAARVLRGGTCACGGKKVPRQAVCRACFLALSGMLQAALYRPLRGGFERAYTEALAWLRAKGRVAA